MIDRKDFKDFQNFVIHDQMKHFVLVEKQPTGWEDRYTNIFYTYTYFKVLYYQHDLHKTNS